MPASLTAATDAALQRISITMAGWSTDTPVTIYREVSGARTPVRGADPLTPLAGGGFLWDYEAPFGVSVRYVAADAGTDIYSGSVSLTETRAWLRVPGLPFYDLPVVPDRYPATERVRPSVTLRPLGRSRPVVISDVLQSETGTVGFLASTSAEADSIAAALAVSPVVLLHFPGTRWGLRYLSISKVSEATASGFADTDLFLFECDFTVVDRPEGALYGDPTNSYQLVLDTFATYSALYSAETSYLDLLSGI